MNRALRTAAVDSLAQPLDARRAATPYSPPRARTLAELALTVTACRRARSSDLLPGRRLPSGVDVVHVGHRPAVDARQHVAAEHDDAAVALVERLAVAAAEAGAGGGRPGRHVLDEHAALRRAAADAEERAAHAAHRLELRQHRA